MCRHLADGGRRCPGHDSPAAREKHNERRRRNRALRSGTAALLKELGGLDHMLPANSSAPQLKGWLIDAGFDPEAITEHTLDRPGQPFVTWSNDEGLPPEVARAVKVGMCLQGQHEEERALLSSHPARRELPEVLGMNVTWKVTFENGAVGYAKPFAYLDHNLAWAYGHVEGPLQPVHEVAAWQLAQRLGEPWSRMVAPCVFREVEGHMCSVSARRFGTEEIPSVDGLNPPESLGFFDSLTGQQDRHYGNVLVGPSLTQLSAIDHGFAFKRPGDEVNNSESVRYRRGRAPELTTHERDVARRLSQSPTLHGLSLMLEQERAQAVRTRARRMAVEGHVVPPGLMFVPKVEYWSAADNFWDWGDDDG